MRRLLSVFGNPGPVGAGSRLALAGISTIVLIHFGTSILDPTTAHDRMLAVLSAVTALHVSVGLVQLAQARRDEHQP